MYNKIILIYLYYFPFKYVLQYVVYSYTISNISDKRLKNMTQTHKQNTF